MKLEFKNIFIRYIDQFNLPIDQNFINYEKSLNYFHDEKVPFRVRSLIKNAKIIVLIRNPVYRAYSLYLVRNFKTFF
jgi:hypothetical protein